MARRVSALGGSHSVRHTPPRVMYATTKQSRRVPSHRALAIAIFCVAFIIVSLTVLPAFTSLVIPSVHKVVITGDVDGGPSDHAGEKRAAASNSETSRNMGEGVGDASALYERGQAGSTSSARWRLTSFNPLSLFHSSRAAFNTPYQNYIHHEHQVSRRMPQIRSKSILSKPHLPYYYHTSYRVQRQSKGQSQGQSQDIENEEKEQQEQQQRYYRQFHHDVAIHDRAGVDRGGSEANHIALRQMSLGDPESHTVIQRPVHAPHAETPPPVVWKSQLKGDDSTAMRAVRSVLARVNGTLLGNPVTRKPFVLYRAIGNDLPPRHARGQAHDNVRFILQHEARFPDLDIRWYVNRLIDATQLLRIVELLVAHNQTFMLDPFDFDAYARIDFDDPDTLHNDRHIPTTLSPESSSDAHGGRNNNPDLTTDVLRSRLFSNAASANSTRRRAFRDRLLHSKNQFIIHNNQARNAMLSLGIAAGAEYILPWDGNCFLTTTAWADISTGVAKVTRDAARAQVDPDARPVSTLYFTVPMARVVDNGALLHTHYMPPDLSEEPQLIFNRQATERFDERLAYGCRPKVDLLWRLRIPGWWTALNAHRNPCVVPSADALSRDVPGFDSVHAVGWTARLFSGVLDLEVSGGIKKRGASRTDGVEFVAARASRVALRRVFNFSSDTLLLYDSPALKRNVARFQSNASVRLRKVVGALLSAADDRARLHMNNTRSQRSHAAHARDAALLALAAQFSKSTVHIRAAILALRKALQSSSPSSSSSTSRRTTTEKTEMKMTTTTRLTIAPAEEAEKEIFDALEGAQLCIVLDAARLLKLSNALSKRDMASISAWVTTRTRWLMSSDSVREAYFDGGLDGTFAEISAACLHAFSSDTRRLLRRTALARFRLRAQYAPEGPGWADGVAGVAAWVVHASMSERVGVNVWHFRAGKTLLLRRALAISVSDAMDTRFAAHVRDEWDSRVAQILVAVANARYRRIPGGPWADLAGDFYAKLHDRRSGKAAWNESLRLLDAPFSDEDDGILPPFWNLAFSS